MTKPEPRSRERRRADTVARLEHDIDLWVATADPGSGAAYLVPLSFLWTGDVLLVSTPSRSITGRNLMAGGRARLGLGHPRDVVMVDGEVMALRSEDLDPDLGDAFAAQTGFDPRTLTTPYTYFRIRPTRVQAWRESNELAGRDLMVDGRWL